MLQHVLASFNTIIADSMLCRLHVMCTEDLQGVAALTSADARRHAICSVHVEFNNRVGEHHENMQYA